MTPRPRPTRRRGYQPIYVGRTVWGPQELPAWYWECRLEECEHEDGPHSTMVNADATETLIGSSASIWRSVVDAGLRHLRTVHPDWEPAGPTFTLYVVSHPCDRDRFWPDGQCRWLDRLGGQAWDLIVIDRPPETKAERVWLEHLATRLRPGGEMFWWDYSGDEPATVTFHPADVIAS